MLPGRTMECIFNIRRKMRMMASKDEIIGAASDYLPDCTTTSQKIVFGSNCGVRMLHAGMVRINVSLIGAKTSEVMIWRYYERMTSALCKRSIFQPAIYLENAIRWINISINFP